MAVSQRVRGRVAAYYTEAGPDYAAWSQRYNMHFGFWSPGQPLGDLEGMLERMNVEVCTRLQAPPGGRVLDLGCGLGATARTVAAQAGVEVVGLTLVPWQAQTARELTRELAPALPITFVEGDYTDAPFPDASFDAAYAVESSCYAPGLDKRALVREAARLLRPGGRLVVADAFLRRAPIRRAITRASHRALCELWALDTLGSVDAFRGALEEEGFEHVQIEDISANTAPSALHVPLVTARHLRASARELGRAGSWRWRHALAGVPLLLFGLDRGAQGYFMVSATRSRAPRAPAAGA